MQDELRQRIETYANARRSDDMVLMQFATARLAEILDNVVLVAKNDPEIAPILEKRARKAVPAAPVAVEEEGGTE